MIRRTDCAGSLRGTEVLINTDSSEVIQAKSYVKRLSRLDHAVSSKTFSDAGLYLMVTPTSCSHPIGSGYEMSGRKADVCRPPDIAKLPPEKANTIKGLASDPVASSHDPSRLALQRIPPVSSGNPRTQAPMYEFCAIPRTKCITSPHELHLWTHHAEYLPNDARTWIIYALLQRGEDRAPQAFRV